MADSLIYTVSSRSDFLEQPFTKRDMVFVIDNNNSSYSGGQILLETSQLANSGRWASYSEAYLTIPLVLGYKSSANISAATYRNPLLLGLKNGFHQLIDSFSCDLNGTNICQLTPYTNFYVSYKMMTSFSADDVAKYGASLNFFPDSVDSVGYSAGGLTASGNGVFNNRVVLAAAENLEAQDALGVALGVNEGFRSRLINLNYRGAGVAQALLPTANAVALGMNVWQESADAAAAKVYYSSIVAKIRLKDLHSFFSEVPLIKGAFFKFTFNLNTATSNITYAAGPPVVYSVAATSDVSIQGRTNPLMIASGEANNPMADFVNNFSIGCGVSSLSLGGTTVNHALFRSCRLYVPLYSMAASYEEQYITMNPSKTIVYRDIYSYAIPNQTQSVNQLLTNGLTAPKALVIIPILNKTGGNNATVAFDPVQSPFTSEPAHPSYGQALRELNVQLSGVNVFQQNEQYDYEAFLNELSRINAINGGQTTGLTSGLIDEYKFSTLYRYYVCDLSRGYASEDMVPKSVQLSCIVGSTKAVDLYCFIEYERKISIDLRSGQVIQV